MTLLSDAVAVHMTRLKSSAGQSVTYTRDGLGSVSIIAAVGRPEYRTDEQTGLIDRIVGRDFIIERKDLVISGNQLTPMRGDKIVLTHHGESLTCEVLPDGGIPHYEEADEFGHAWRIHTKFVNVTP